MRGVVAGAVASVALALLAVACSSAGDPSAGPGTTVGLRPVVLQDVELWSPTGPAGPNGRPCPEGVAPWRSWRDGHGYRATFSDGGVERFAIKVDSGSPTGGPSLHVIDDGYWREAVDRFSTFMRSSSDRDVEAVFGAPAVDWRYLRCGQVDDARFEVTRVAGSGTEKVTLATSAGVLSGTTSGCTKAWASVGGSTHLACIVEGAPGPVEVLDSASGATRPLSIVGTSVGQGLGVVVVDVTGAIEPGDSADVAYPPPGTSTVVLKLFSVGPDGSPRPR